MPSYSKFTMYIGSTVFRGEKKHILNGKYYNVYSRIDEYKFEHVRSIYEVKITINYITQSGISKKIVIKFNHDIRILLQYIINTVREDVEKIMYNRKTNDKLSKTLGEINLYTERTSLLSYINHWKKTGTDTYSNLEDILTE